MDSKVEWRGVLDNLDCDIEGAAARGVDPTRWPARVERIYDGSVRLVIAADGLEDFSGSVRPSRCRDLWPELPEALARELVDAGELDE